MSYVATAANVTEMNPTNSISRNFPLVKQIGDKYEPFDSAAIPIGAYAPRWFMAPAHTDPVDAVTIHKDDKAETSIGIHWGTFPLADESFFMPVAELLTAVELSTKPVQLVFVKLGESLMRGDGSVAKMKADCKELLEYAAKTTRVTLTSKGGRMSKSG